MAEFSNIPKEVLVLYGLLRMAATVTIDSRVLGEDYHELRRALYTAIDLAYERATACLNDGTLDQHTDVYALNDAAHIAASDWYRNLDKILGTDQ